MADLSLRHIDKIYDNNVQAVFDFNLEIKDKEFLSDGPKKDKTDDADAEH